MRSQLSSALSQLRRVVVQCGDAGLSDAQLLQRFNAQRDEAAFEVLVWRHGAMVLGVGRRLLHNLDDAEDVLQATFLALVRQAGSIGRGALAGWLYQVAYRIALRAKRQRQKRAFAQADMEQIAAPGSSKPGEASEVGSMLDEELQRLPEKYRTPLLLSYVHGLTNQEIANQLACPIQGALLGRRLPLQGLLIHSPLDHRRHDAAAGAHRDDRHGDVHHQLHA